MPRKTSKVVKKKNTTEDGGQNFETALSELESIVTKLETGEAPLDKALELYESGIALSKYCSGQLKDAERRVELLEDKKGHLAGKNFDDDDQDDGDDDELDWEEDEEDDDDEDMEDEIDDLDDEDEEEDDDEDDFEDEEEDDFDEDEEDRRPRKKGRPKKQDELF